MSLKSIVRCLCGAMLASLLAACGGGGGGNEAGVIITPPPPINNKGPADCVGGNAAGFACNNVALAKHLDLSDLGAASGNDIWGWTDPTDNSEYALMGVDNGTVFVNITTPDTPVVIGRLPTETVASPWRDIKVFGNFAYIVADGGGAHGMQVFDLTRLRAGGTNQTFAADVTYSNFENAHNIAINEDSGFAYVVGTNTCDGGLHMVDIRQPINPMFAGCHSGNGDAHDTQCVNYIGPDTDHAGAEICFNSNEDSVLIVDVSVKSSPLTLSSHVYPNLEFVHQAWLDDTQRYLLVNDEFDEIRQGVATSTIVIDVSDLDAPAHLYTHRHATPSTDHNLYVLGNRVFEANYTSGLRILEFTNLATNTFTEVGFFDTFPANDDSGTDGAWSVYPYFSSGTVVVSDVARGLFILTPN